MTVINVYCPRADPEREDRKAFKQRFYQLLQIRAENILRNGSHVIILGDVNTSHKKIDHCDPDESEVYHVSIIDTVCLSVCVCYHSSSQTDR